MTIASDIDRSGPYNGNGVTTAFDYEFRITNEAHVRVVRGNSDGTETTLDLGADYAVTGVGGADGGQIICTVAPATGTTITNLREVPFTQETDLENQGAYLAQVVEDALDLAVMRDQQLAEELNRAVKLPASSDLSGDDLGAQFVEDITALAGVVSSIPVVAAISSDVQTVADIATDVALLADHSGILSGTASAVRMDEKIFTGDGVTVNWTLDRAPGVDENVLVWVGGAVQKTANYSVSGTTLTLSPAVANGVEIRTLTMTLVTANDIEALVDLAEAAAALAASYGKYNYATEAEFSAANIPLTVMYIDTAGYYAAGDGGGHRKIRIAAPGVVEPWHKQSADGAWWQISKQRLDVRMFGAKIDGATDDAPAINAGIRLSVLYGVEVFQPAGISMQGSTITLRHGSAWVGFNYLSFVRKLPTFNGVAVQSENFATLTGTGDAFAANVPERVCAKYITLDGNYQNAARTAYVQANGQGVQIFARKVQLFLRVFNMQGVGVWLECPGGNGPTPLQPGFSREAEIVLYLHQTQHEGLVFKGPADVKLEWVVQADAGSRIVADENNGKVSSPTYGAVNGGQTFGVVFDGKGAEVGEIHTFGNYGGGGIDWRNGGRINATMLMAESCLFGGIRVSGAAEGTINNLDVHRTGGFGGDTTPDFVYDGTGGNNKAVEIAVLSCYRKDAAHTGARNGVHVTGDFLNIGVLKVDLGSTATAGHGLYIDNDTAQWITINGGEIARCKGVAADGLASSGIYRKTVGNGSIVDIKCTIRDCDVAFRSDGTPRVEDIDLKFLLVTGQAMFAGSLATNPGQDWDIKGTINGVFSSLKSDNRILPAEASTLTIAGGAVTVGLFSYYPIETEAAAATDDLDTINGGAAGQIIVLRAATSTRDVVVTEAGNIRLNAAGATFTLNNSQDRIVLQYDGTVWNEISRSDNSA